MTPSTPPRPPVYRAAKPTAPRASDQYVPPVFSAEFTRFAVHFAGDPTANAVFLAEVRRHRRRLGWIGENWPFALVLLCVAGGLAGVGAIALETYVNPIAFNWILAGLWIFPALGCGVYAFFGGLAATVEMGRVQVLEQYAVTPLRPQEIAWGHLCGALLPASLVAVPLLPGWALVALHTCTGESMLDGYDFPFGASLLLFLLPITAATTLLAGSIPAALGLGERGWVGATFRSLVALLAVGIPLIPLPILAGFGVRGPMFSLVMFVLLLMELAVAGGFVNHLAFRLARRRAEEEMGNG